MSESSTQRPTVESVELADDHPTPQWRHVVSVAIGGRHMPMAASMSPARAAIVERALRLLAETETGLADELAAIGNNA
jgi:hypothetical protein